MSDSNSKSEKADPGPGGHVSAWTTLDPLIREYSVPGSVRHFRGTLQRFGLRSWFSSAGKKLIIAEDQDFFDDTNLTITRGRWNVSYVDEPKKATATVEAFEDPDGKSTLVEFHDGTMLPFWRDPKDAIGDELWELAQYVVISLAKGTELSTTNLAIQQTKINLANKSTASRSEYEPYAEMLKKGEMPKVVYQMWLKDTKRTQPRVSDRMSFKRGLERCGWSVDLGKNVSKQIPGQQGQR